MKQMGGRVVLKESHPQTRRAASHWNGPCEHCSPGETEGCFFLERGTRPVYSVFLSLPLFCQQNGGKAIHLNTERIPWMVTIENEATTSGNCFVGNPRVGGLSLSWGLSESKSL